MTPGVLVLVPAAGVGVRMGGARKPWLRLGGRSVLDWALAPFLAREDVVEVVVAVGPGGEADSGDQETGDHDPRVRFVAGGDTRFASVGAAFDAADSGGARSGAEIVAVHDGARPFPPPDVIDACIQAAATGVVAVAGTPAVDTVKRADEQGRVLETPDRHALWYAQTPQVFPRPVFARALARCRAAGASPTDDAAMAELLGSDEVRMVAASARNLKITRPEDLVVAEAYVRNGLV